MSPNAKAYKHKGSDSDRSIVPRGRSCGCLRSGDGSTRKSVSPITNLKLSALQVHIAFRQGRPPRGAFPEVASAAPGIHIDPSPDGCEVVDAVVDRDYRRIRIVSQLRKPVSHYYLSRYSPGTSSSDTSCVRTSFPSAFPASSTPVTTSASNAFPSSSNSPTLCESAPSTLDNPSKSPDCWPERALSPSGENETVSTLWLFSRTCFLSALAVFAPIVFWPTAFVFTAAFLGAGFFADFFLAIPLFLASSFFGVTFLPAVLVAFVGFF